MATYAISVFVWVFLGFFFLLRLVCVLIFLCPVLSSVRVTCAMSVLCSLDIHKMLIRHTQHTPLDIHKMLIRHTQHTPFFVLCMSNEQKRWIEIVLNTLWPQEFPGRRQRNGDKVVTYRHLLDYLEMLASSSYTTSTTTSTSSSMSSSSFSPVSEESASSSSPSAVRVQGREEREEGARGLGRVRTHFLPFLGV